MPILSFAEAARRAGVDSSTIKRKVNKGLLSTSTRPDGTKGIELSELARLYPQVVAQAPDRDTPMQTPAHAQVQPEGDVTIFQRDVELLRLRQEVEHLRRELATTQDREQTAMDRERWYQERIQALEQRLLPPPRKRLGDRLAELIERLRRRQP